MISKEKDLESLVVPAQHLNGSGKNLEIQYTAAADALYTALDKLRQCAPHMRDYYVRPDGEQQFKLATEQHLDRCSRIESVIEELGFLYGKLMPCK